MPPSRAPVPSFCRICSNACAILVDVEGGKVRNVRGDRANPLFRGYSCLKGRAQPHMLVHPERLLHSQQRARDGYRPVTVAGAVDRVADGLSRVLDRYGPDAVAAYTGTMGISSWATERPVVNAFLSALGSDRVFTPNTLDKGGKQIAAALHGSWMAPSQGFDRPDVALLVGINPLVTYTGLPAGNPGAWLNAALKRGMSLVVIDPRRTESARRATVFLQPRPGEDAAVLAGMIRVILAEALYDHAFVSAHTSGVDALRNAVEPFTPQYVAYRADIDPDGLVAAARLFGEASRGYAMAGTGPSMSSQGTLVEYLILNLETLCGHWLREGEVVHNAPTLRPAAPARAQAQGPANPIWSDSPMRVRGLSRTVAGLPTAALADEMLLEGDGRVRVLFSVSGNPALAFPDQHKTVSALQSLDLLVQFDPWMSATAQLADFVIAPPLPLELPGATVILDDMSARSTGYGLDRSYAQWTPAVVAPPDGAELIEVWRFFYRLARRMGLTLTLQTQQGAQDLDMECEPSTEDVIELMCAGGRVPLDEVRAHAHGHFFPEPVVTVGPAESGSGGRLQLADSSMMQRLRQIARQRQLGGPWRPADDGYPFRLVCRRHAHVYNSSGNIPETNRGRRYNPCYMHPTDLEALGVVPGERVRVSSPRGEISAIAAADTGLRRGVVSMAFGFGPYSPDIGNVLDGGSSVSRLIADDEVFDPYIGQPRMSNVPVQVVREQN